MTLIEGLVGLIGESWPPYGKYLLAFLSLLITLFLARTYQLFYSQLVNYLKKRTQLKFGGIIRARDVVLDSLEKPLYWAIILVGFYFSLRFIIPPDFISLYQKVYVILAILWGLFSSIKILGELMRWNLSQKRTTKVRRTVFLSLKRLVDIFLFILAALLILLALKVEITPLIASLGIGGLAVALALQPTIANYFSGLYVTMDQSLRVGDYIELENNLQGYVEDIGWRATQIRTLPNNIIIIPNAKLTDMIVTNYHAPVEEMSTIIECGVAYDSDLEKVEKITIEVARKVLSKVPGGVKEFTPFIRYHTFGDSNIKFSIILRVREFVDKYYLSHEFIKALKKRFDQEGIEISFPVRNIYMRESKKSKK